MEFSKLEYSIKDITSRTRRLLDTKLKSSLCIQGDSPKVQPNVHIPK